MEKDSEDIFALAESAVQANPKIQAVIVKHMPRFDKASDDILGIKPSLSAFANNIYDQLWLKAGSPEAIILIEIDLNISGSKYLEDLIY